MSQLQAVSLLVNFIYVSVVGTCDLLSMIGIHTGGGIAGLPKREGAQCENLRSGLEADSWARCCATSNKLDILLLWRCASTRCPSAWALENGREPRDALGAEQQQSTCQGSYLAEVGCIIPKCPGSDSHAIVAAIKCTVRLIPYKHAILHACAFLMPESDEYAIIA